MQQYLTYSGAADPRAVTGSGVTPDHTLPSNAVICTAEQAAQWHTFAIVNGQIVAGTAPVLTLAQQASNLLIAGISITSTSGAWTATFPAATDQTGANVWTLVLSELVALNLSGGITFADGAPTVQWPDIGGTLHAMSPVQFQAFARALGSFVAVCRNIINGVPGAELPPASATIV